MRRIRAGFVPAISVDPAHHRPLYRQLYDGFQRAIAEGRLRPGQRVPSTRHLAAELKISRIPVVTAYEQLQAEGYLETFVGAGTCVAAAIPEDALVPPSRATPGSAERCAGRRVSRRVEAVMSTPQDPSVQAIGAFRVSLPALDHFPRDVWSSLLARHQRNPALDRMAYGDPMGWAPFREAIAEYVGASRAVRCDASQVMIVAGSQQALQITARALLDDGDPVWMEEPGYPGAHRALFLSGAVPVPVPIDQDGLDVEEAIRRRPDARTAYITPSHQYPMGMTMSAARRMLLLNWAARAGAWIIEDDYDSEYRFAGRPIASLQGLDGDDRVIYVGTFSKVLFPALRLGYLVIPKDLVPAFRAAREAMDIFPPTLFQAALTDFIREGHFARHIRRMRMLYMERRRLLAQAIEAQMGDLMQVVSAEAGMHLVGLVDPRLDDMALSRAVAERGLSAIPLSTCYLETPDKAGLVLGYGGTDGPAIQAGVRKLSEVLRAAQP